MASTHTSIEAAPQQGELFTGTEAAPRLQTPPEPEVIPGVSVNLQERNEALAAALTRLGSMASSAAFREIGRRQTEGERGPAIQAAERRYSQPELVRKIEASEAKTQSIAEAVEDSLSKAFGVKQLIRNRQNLMLPNGDGRLVNLSEDDILDAFRSGAGILGNDNERAPAGHKEGKEEFQERFAGSNNRGPRDRYKAQLKRQATQLKKVARKSSN